MIICAFLVSSKVSHLSFPKREKEPERTGLRNRAHKPEATRLLQSKKFGESQIEVILL